MDGLKATGTIFRRLAVVVILGATFAVSAMVTVYALFHSGEVIVPDVKGMAEEQAKQVVERAGLSFRTRRIHFDSEIAQGTISEQDPAPGFPVKAGFQVKVDVSKGPNPTGEEEPEDIPIGPNVPQAANANTNKAKKKPTNANGNVNASNSNKGAPATNTAPSDTNSAKPPKPPEEKKPEVQDDAKPKPKPKPPDPPPPSR